ncbi:hypothetical protein EVAR_38928_1 [Eumeta japonica]|uniref:Uncharacterized protein n=1 Tax=Eumeta variegata TaxID=151549 RepID=A0A4C1ZRJ4_EUMVA|nr:hypothetical protein EVAR_38928_1 [Eumeta japonica]
MGPPDGGRPIYQNHRLEESVDRVRKIDTPPLNSIPDDIRTTEQIDHAIGALTSHVRTVVKRCEREVPASSDRRKFPPDILELIRAKTKLLRELYPTRISIQARLNAKITKGAQNGGYTPIPRLKTGRLHRPRRRGGSGCIANSIETQCSRLPARHSSYSSRGRGSSKPPSNRRRSDTCLTQRSPTAGEIAPRPEGTGP